jgi:hypothetical protein
MINIPEKNKIIRAAKSAEILNSVIIMYIIISGKEIEIPQVPELLDLVSRRL